MGGRGPSVAFTSPGALTLYVSPVPVGMVPVGGRGPGEGLAELQAAPTSRLLVSEWWGYAGGPQGESLASHPSRRAAASLGCLLPRLPGSRGRGAHSALEPQGGQLASISGTGQLGHPVEKGFDSASLCLQGFLFSKLTL